MREGIVGFTLGELGTLLAFVLLFVVGIQRSEGRGIPVERADSMQSALQQLQDSIGALARAMAASEDTLARLRELQSRQTPSCREAGLAGGLLFSAEVLGDDRFRINDAVLSYSELLTRYSADIRNAEDADCVHQVTSYAGSDVSGDALARAQARLQRTFYHSVRP
jgi:hypothetical protein